MHNVDIFSNENVAENRKRGKDGGKGGVSIENEKRHIIDLYAVG